MILDLTYGSKRTLYKLWVRENFYIYINIEKNKIIDVYHVHTLIFNHTAHFKIDF